MKKSFLGLIKYLSVYAVGVVSGIVFLKHLISIIFAVMVVVLLFYMCKLLIFSLVKKDERK